MLLTQWCNTQLLPHTEFFITIYGLNLITQRTDLHEGLKATKIQQPRWQFKPWTFMLTPQQFHGLYEVFISAKNHICKYTFQYAWKPFQSSFKKKRNLFKYNSRKSIRSNCKNHRSSSFTEKLIHRKVFDQRIMFCTHSNFIVSKFQIDLNAQISWFQSKQKYNTF